MCSLTAANVSVVERGLDGLLLEEARHLDAAGPPLGVLAACRRQVEATGEGDGLQDLELLGPEVRGVEGDRLLHRDQREQLEEVVLDHVAGGADAVVVAGAAADADVLGHGDLHVVDVVGVPERLEHLVGEPHRQDVLHRLLPEVVVDPEDRLRREGLGQGGLELLGRLEVVPEGLLDHHPTPGVGALVDHVVLLELVDHHAEEPRRDRQVERVVAARAPHHVELVEGAREVGERDVVVEVAGHEPEPLGELGPDLLAELGAGVLLHRVVHDRGEVLVGPVAPGEAHQAEARRQQAAVGQVVDRRHDLLARQVAGDAEQHHPARPGDAGQPPVPRVAQRVGPVGRTHRSACRTASSEPGPSRCRRSTGRPFSARTCPSPTAWAIRNSWKVNGRSGTARSRSGWPVTWR